MSTKLIELEDGTLVEVEVTQDQSQGISAGFAEPVNSDIYQIEKILVKTSHPLIDALKRISERTKIKQAEVEFGLSFEKQGNVYITKSKTAANLSVKITIQPNNEPEI